MSDLVWAEATPPAVTPTARMSRPAVSRAHERRAETSLDHSELPSDECVGRCGATPDRGAETLANWSGFRSARVRSEQRVRAPGGSMRSGRDGSAPGSSPRADPGRSDRAAGRSASTSSNAMASSATSSPPTNTFGVVVHREAVDDVAAEPAGVDVRRERRGRDHGHRRGADAGHDERHRDGQLDPPDHLAPVHAHPAGRPRGSRRRRSAMPTYAFASIGGTASANMAMNAGTDCTGREQPVGIADARPTAPRG